MTISTTYLPNIPAGTSPGLAAELRKIAEATRRMANDLSLGATLVQGAFGDGIQDDHDAIQAAIDEAHAAGGGMVVLGRPPERYKLGRSLFMRSGVTLYVPDPSTEIYAAGDFGGIYSAPMQRSAVNFGSYIDRNWDEVRAALKEPIADVVVGDVAVTLATPDNAAHYPVGTVVCVLDTTDTIASNTDPEWGQHNVVTSADPLTGVLGLRYPIDRTRTSVSIVRMNNTGILAWAGAASPNRLPEENWCVRDAKLIGGTWVAPPGAWPLININGAVNCVIAPDKVLGGLNAPPYANNMAYCDVSCDEVVVDRALVETAQVSHDNRIFYRHATSRTPTGNYLIWFPQGRNNIVECDTVYCQGPFEAAVVFSRAVANRVRINRLIGPAAEVAVVIFTGAADPALTSDNLVSIRRSDVATQPRYVRFLQGAPAPVPRNNLVVDSQFYGAITGNGGHLGAECSSGINSGLRDVYFENGGVVLSGGANFSEWDFSRVRVNTRGGAGDYNLGSGNYLMYGGFRDITFPRLARQDAVARVFVNKDVTDVAPFNETVALPADTLAVPDTLSVEVRGRCAGSNGTKTVTVTFAGTVVATGTIPAGTVFWRLRVDIAPTANNTATYHSEFIEGANVAPGGGQINGLNLSGTGYNLDLSVSAAAAGDTCKITRAAIAFDSPARDRVRCIA